MGEAVKTFLVSVQFEIHTKYNSKTKQTIQNTSKQNYLRSVTSYDIRPGNNVGLFYNAPEPTQEKFYAHKILYATSDIYLKNWSTTIQ